VIARVIGKTLRRVRAGDPHLAWNDTILANVPAAMRELLVAIRGLAIARGRLIGTFEQS
jgi:hypothetical protein